MRQGEARALTVRVESSTKYSTKSGPTCSTWISQNAERALQEEEEARQNGACDEGIPVLQISCLTRILLLVIILLKLTRAHQTFSSNTGGRRKGQEGEPTSNRTR